MSKNISQNKLLETIQQVGPITKKELQKKLNLTLTTLNRMLVPLFDNRWLYITDEKSTTGGRPSNSIDIDRSLYAVIGIDISRTYIKVILTTLKMDILETEIIDLSQVNAKEAVLHEIIERIQTIKKNHSRQTVLAIGIGSVGPVDPDKGILKKPSYIQIEDWDQVPIKDILQDTFSLPVYLNTGANMALLAETYFDEDKYNYHAAYINCGVGIRNSTIINGKVLKTLGNREDTLGHTSISSDGELCYCGSKDCIDLRSSIRGMLKKYSTLTGNHYQLANYPDFFAMQNQSDDVNGIIKNGAEALGVGIANYIKLYNLNYVIIGGPLVNYSNYYYNQVVKYTLENLGDLFNPDVNLIKGGKYQADSIAIGSAIFASQRSIEGCEF